MDGEVKEIFSGVLNSLDQIGESFDQAIKNMDYSLKQIATTQREIDILKRNLHEITPSKYGIAQSL